MAMAIKEAPRLLEFAPDLIDHIAETDPQRTYISIPTSDHIEDGYRDITYKQLAAAVDKIAFWLDDVVPCSTLFEAFTYYGPNDVRWAFLSFASQKSRRTHLMLNPNNSLAADLDLLGSTKCKTIITTEKYEHRFADILKQRTELRVVHFPGMEVWLEDGPARPYQYHAPSAENAIHTPWEISHTSGTTGQPKSLHYTTAYQSVVTRQLEASNSGALESPFVYSKLKGRRFLLLFPQTWAAGLHNITEQAVIFGMIPVLLPESTPYPVSLDVLLQALKHVDFSASLVLPFHLQQMTKHPDILEALAQKNLDFLGFAGAGVDPVSGATVSKYTRLQAFYGNTEVGNQITLPTAPEDWQYVGFSFVAGCSLEPYDAGSLSDGEEQLYELVLRRERDPHRLLYIFVAQPELTVFHTRDLFKAHPDPAKKNFWLPAGRADDLNKNSNLTKFHAGHVERAIERHPLVQGALMGGQGQERPFLIVEIRREDCNGMSQEEVRQKVWLAVEESNQRLSKEVRIAKERLIVAPQGKPLKRLGKGSVDRRAILVDFQEEINALPA